jgi:hypothetical protein
VIVNSGSVCTIIFSLSLVLYGVILSSLRNHSSEGRMNDLSPVDRTSLWWFCSLSHAYLHAHLSHCNPLPTTLFLSYLKQSQEVSSFYFMYVYETPQPYSLTFISTVSPFLHPTSNLLLYLFL